MFDPNPDDNPHSSYHIAIQLTLIALATVSSLISLLIPALYHIKRQCRQHPTNLISKISLLQALSNYNIILIAVNIYKFESYVDIRNVFDLITFNQPQQPTDTDFCEINYVLYMILELSSIAYNIAFSIDLFVTLKFPFYAGKKRTKFYNIFSILFLCSTIPEAVIQAYDICENEYHNKAIYKVPIIFIIALGIFYTLSFIIIIYSFIETKKLGKVRAQYIRHHRVILIILLSSWVFPLWTNILIQFGDESSDHFYIINLLSFVTLLLLGALVNIVRFYHDHFLWQQVKKMVKCKKTIKYKTDKEDLQNKLNKIQSDIWNLPLAAAVAQLNNQKVVHSLIQVVAYACSQQEIPKILKLNSNFQKTSRSKSIVTFTTKEKKILETINQNNSITKNKNQLLQKFIERNVQNATLSQLKKISKRQKKFNMFCLNDRLQTAHNQIHLSLKQKTVFAQQKNSKKRPTTQTNQNNHNSQRQRTNSQIKNHLSLNQQKDLHKLRNDMLMFKQNSQSIDFSKQQTYFQSQSDLYRNRKDNIEIKVVSHAHQIFTSIRKMNGLGEEQLQQSLDLQNNVDCILKAKQSLGASGSFFFFSYDHKLIIKTIAEGQDAILLDLLPKYYLHLKKHKHTLLTKIYGMYSVEIAGISKITFILMQNSFHRMERQGVVYKKYDLKGSTVSRQVRNPKADVLKDVNYLRSNDAFIMMDPQQRDNLINQIQQDIKLLRGQNIMDYSLLLGVGVKTKQKIVNQFKPTQSPIKIFANHFIPQTEEKNEQLNFEQDILKRKRQQFDKYIASMDLNKKKSQQQRKLSYQQLYEKSWKYIDQYKQLSGRIYSISIIDYLQQFNFNKYMELQLKKVFKGGGDISSVDSDYYFYRFLNFVKKIIIPVKNFKPKLKQNYQKHSKKQSKSQRQQSIRTKTKKIFQIKLGDQWQDLGIKVQ